MRLSLAIFLIFFLSIFENLSAKEIDLLQEINQGRFIKIIPEYGGVIKRVENNIFYFPQINKKEKIQIGKKSSNGNIFLCQKEFSQVCEVIYGRKYPDIMEEKSLKGQFIETINLVLKEKMANSKKERGVEEGDYYNGLEDYVFASPNQEDAGSCLFMAHTGALEILMNKKIDPSLRLYDGESDFSERFLMNVDAPENVVPNWRTDMVYSYHYAGGALLNRDYRYTKGWYKDVNGVLKKSSADESSDGAEYGAYFNWLDDYNNKIEIFKDKLVKVPLLERDILFEDSNHEVWNTAQMSYEDVEKIKKVLKEKNSPVLIIYNHFAYWHAVLIVGYDDNKDNGGCPFVTRWRSVMREKAEILLASSDPKEKERGERYMRYVNQVDARWAIHGCRDKGVFFVRDSIYTGEAEPLYDYDLNNVGDERFYSKKIVEKSYDWPYYLGNHAYIIYEK